MATNFTYDAYGRTEPSRIYLARPGKRLLGPLNGVRESTCNLTLNFVSADEISFDVYKYHDEELTNYYDYIDVLMEIYVDGFGWFFIDESPTVHNDGKDEYKSVIAKSYDWTLHQYDLVGFDINTAAVTSREMMATDNVYTFYSSAEVWYNLFRDRVLFYRDTSEHKELLAAMTEETTYAELQQLLADYPKVTSQDWRITIPIDDSLRAGFVQMKENYPAEASYWQTYIDMYDTNTGGLSSDFVKTLMTTGNNKELIKYITVEFNKKKYERDYETGKYDETNEEYTAYELMEMEYQRIKELSLLDLVFSCSGAPGWEIEYVDPEPDEKNGIQLKNEVGSFEIDSQDVYSFLVTELTGYYNCIFKFDTINNKINVYRIESKQIGHDTKIFLGFRNIQNSVDITPAQDLFTQFTVENSEGLTITDVNFGEREIEDISYFLNTKYLPQELIDKYKIWLKYREKKRPQYIEMSRQVDAQTEKVLEIKSRVPSDMLKVSQYDNYKSQDQLEEVIDNYYALMVGMLDSFIYVSKDDINPPEDRDTYQDYDDYIADWNAYIAELEELVDVNKDENTISFADSVYKNDYDMMKGFTIPNLIIAYHNLDLPSYETKTEYYDAYEFDFETYGDMYGLDELKAYKKSHEDKMDVYKEYATAWEDIPDTEEGNAFKAKYTEADYTSKHNLYIKYKNGYDSVCREIEERQQEYDAAYDVLEQLDLERQRLADSVKMENFGDASSAIVLHDDPEGWLYTKEDDDGDGNDDYAYLTLGEGETLFTDAEIERLARFFRHTDYVNDNINYLKSIDTTDSTIDKQEEMYGYAVDELYAEAHPQYTYSTSVDDLLANNEYELYHPDFEVGNFVWLGLDDEAQVKLRMITIQFNPMIYDNNLQITFSNMVQYWTKRNDFQSLLNSAITSAKNSIQARYNRETKDNTVEVTYDLVQKILQSGSFTQATQNITAGAVSATAGEFQSLATGYLKTTELQSELANITELHSDSAFMNFLQSNLIVAKALNAESADIAELSTRSLTADSADIASLATQAVTAQSIDASNINVDNLFAESGLFEYLESNLVTASEIKVDDLKAKLAQIDSLEANSAFVQFLSTDITTAHSLSADNANFATAAATALTAGSIDASNITTDNLTANDAIIQWLQSSFIATDALVARSVKAENIDTSTITANDGFISFLQSNAITTNELKAHLADVDAITAGSAFANYLHSVSSTTVQSVVDQAYIRNLIVGNLTAADLAASDLVLTDMMRIISQNENGGNVLFDGDALQFTDSEGNVGIEIGYGSQDYPHIIITDENGTSLWTSTGVTSEGIGDDIIYGRMINDNTISREKLDFPIVDTDEDGNISITKIKNGSGGNFGVEYVNFTNNTNQALQDLGTRIDESATYTLTIDAPQGTNIKGGSIQLDATLYKNSEDVTALYDASCFIWTRQSQDSYGDMYWNDANSQGTKSIIVTANDVRISADFKCTFEFEGTTVSSS